MSIEPGSRLQTYEITALIGKGGMGEVYQAHDTKLGRDVAIKVLPEKFAHDSERLGRFQREAKLLAALNHPNIATIHGLEESGNTHYLVMELVPGETLRDRILRDGPIPLQEALNLARQIAEALEAAHGSDKGIIHRDLKPANIKVTPEGRVKVLDFGLAKAFEVESSAENIANSPTLSVLPTMQGVILGTAAYMSPEQASGKTVTKATDIWALGAVLYEMLTATQAFHGDDVANTLAAVLKAEPDWNRLPGTTPPAIQTLLRRCLRKDRRQRLSDASAMRIEIEEALAGAATEMLSPGTEVAGWRRGAMWGLATVAVATTAAIATWYLKPSPAFPALPVTRTVISLPPGQQLAGLDRNRAVALSPDGTHLAYVARQGNVQQLYLRAMDGLESRVIPESAGAVNPFFSPDSRWLAFFAGGKLKKVSVSGGAAVVLSDAALPLGGSWGTEGMIAFVPTSVSPIEQVSDAGGKTQPLTRLEKGEFNHSWPEFLPDGKGFLFTVSSTVAGSQVAVQSATGERKILAPGGVGASYAPTRHLIYMQNGNLMAVPFDLQRLTIAGTAIPVVDSVLQVQGGVNSVAQYSLSPTGSLVYVLGNAQADQRRLAWVDRQGTETPVAAPARMYATPRLSPDGRRIAVSTREPGNPILLYEFSRETLTRFTFEGTVSQFPNWTPDGKRIAFNSNLQGSVVNLFWQLADGSGGLERLTTSEFSNWPTSWSPDGQLLTYVENNPNTRWDVWVLRMSDRKAEPFVRTPANEGGPQFSPDGRWIAYSSDESGRWEVYVQPYPGTTGKWQVSTEGGTEALWNPNGKELFYRNGDKMVAVDIGTQPSFSAGAAHTLFERPYQLSLSPIAAYDVSRDGQRFLMLKPDVQNSSSSLTQIVVVQNWLEELKRLVPTGTP